MVTALDNSREAIAALCRKYGVVRLEVFGSVLRDDYEPGRSDVDLLAEFAPRDPYSLAEAYFTCSTSCAGFLAGRSTS